MGYEIRPAREAVPRAALDRRTRDFWMEMRRGLLVQLHAIEQMLEVRPHVERCPKCGALFGGSGGLHIEDRLEYKGELCALEEEVADGE